jgi:PAS domain S-box-containing protein
MASPLVTISGEATLQEALAFSREKRFKRLVVVNHDGEVVGLLHQKDLVALVYEKWRNLLDEQQRHLEAEKALFKGGPVLLFIWQAREGWPVHFVSDNIEPVLGYSAGLLMAPGFRFTDIVHPDDGITMSEQVRGYLAEQRSYWEQNYRLRHQDGSYRWFYDYTRPVYDEQGKPSLIYGYLLDQTQLIESKNQAEQAQQRLELALESADTGLWVWDMLSNEIDWSDQAYTQLGYAPQAFSVSLAVFEPMIHPQDLAPMFAEIARQMQAHHGFVVEFRAKNADGAWIWLQGRGRVTRTDAQGKPIQMMGTHLNIQAQKRAQDAIAQSQQRLQNIIWGTGVGTWEWNVQSGETLFNARWAELVGYDLAELQPSTIETWLAFIHPDDMALSEQRLQAHFVGETDHYEAEVRMRHKAGHWIWVLDRGKVVSRNEAGEPLWMAGTHQDITERKQSEMALQQAKNELERNERLLEDGEALAKIGGWEYEVATQKMYWTQGLFKLHGFEPSPDFDHVAQSLHCYRQQDQATIMAAFERCIREGEPYDLVFAFTSYQGEEKWIRTRTAPLRDQQGKVARVIGIVADISEQKQNEQQLNTLIAQANAASQAKSDFLANMSHEIRTPMNGIIGLSELALKVDKVEVLHQQLDKIYRSGRLLLGIINDILDFSKIEAGKLEIERHPFYLGKLLDEVHSLFALSAQEKGLLFEVAGDSALAAALLGDEMRLRQVLTNLVSNAIKFTEQGHVRVRTRAETDNEGTDWWHFVIDDSGIGISPSQQTRLFQAFSQADSSITRKHGGTGLGLVISQRLVQAMGGEGIRVESTLQRGSRFSFRVPMARCSAEQQAQLQAKLAAAPDKSHLSGRVLLVEDNEINQEVAQEQLQQMGLSVTLAKNGEIAVEKVKNGHFDVILMDIQMPIMDGYQATQAIRRFNPTVPIIALTAAAMIEDKQKALSVGMNGHLSKPINTHELNAVLAQTLAEQAANANADTGSDGALAKAVADSLAAPNNAQTLALINQAAGLAQLGGNGLLYDKLLKKLADQLAQDYADLAEQLAKLAQSGEADEAQWIRLQQQNHALKGVVGNLAIDALYQQTQLLDRALKQRQAPTPQQAAEFKRVLEATRSALAAWQTAEVAPTPTTAALSLLIPTLSDLLASLEQSEFIDEAQLQQLGQQLPAQYQQAWLSIVAAIDGFEFEQAAYALNDLIDRLCSA